MSTIRIKKDREQRFVQLYSSMFEDKNISLKAKGLLGFCMTKTEDWVFYIEQLAGTLKEKHRAINSALNELILFGYAIRYQTRKENGDYGHWETIISDSKDEILRVKKDMEKSGEFKEIFAERRFARAHFTAAQNDVLPNKDGSNKNQSNKKPPTPTPSKNRVDEKPSKKIGGGGSLKKDDLLNAIVPYECLVPLEIPDIDKRRLTRDYAKDLVEKVVRYVTRPKFRIASTLDAAIFYFCKNPHHITETKEDKEIKKAQERDNLQKLIKERKTNIIELRKKNWDELQKKRVLIRENSSDTYVEIGTRDGFINEKVYYDNPNFDMIVEHFLRKLEIYPLK